MTRDGASATRDSLLSLATHTTNAVLRQYFYSSRTIARWVFDGRFEPFRGISFFELGTILTKRVLARELRPGSRVLDVGTGPYAILAVWAGKRLPLRLVATDIDPSVCAAAKWHAHANEVNLDIRCADLFQGIDGLFDTILFHAPGKGDDVVLRHLKGRPARDPATAALLRIRSSGGAQGWELIDRFLADLGSHLAPHGCAYLCINRFHIDPRIIRERLAMHGLCGLEEHRGLICYSVFVIGTGAPGEPA